MDVRLENTAGDNQVCPNRYVFLILSKKRFKQGSGLLKFVSFNVSLWLLYEGRWGEIQYQDGHFKSGGRMGG